MATEDTPDAQDVAQTVSGQTEAEKAGETTETVERPADSPHTPWVAHEVSKDVYEAMVADWLSGECRTKSALSRKYHLAWDTAQKAVDRGWPQRGWASLKQREALHAEVTKKAAVTAKAMEQQSFRQAMLEHTGILRSTLAMCAQLVKGLYESGAQAKWVRTKRRRTYDAAGNVNGWEEYDAPLTGPELSMAAGRLSMAMRDISSTLLMWHEKDHNVFNTPADPDAAAKGWLALSQEQIDHIIKHDGELPPGVTVDMLLGASPSVKSN